MKKSLIVRAVLLSCISILTGLFLTQNAEAISSVTLTWNTSADPNATGYKIYYGTTSGDYTNSIDVGNTTSATIVGLVDGVTYYFAATTYDSSGDESDFSNETSYDIGENVSAVLSSAANVNGQFTFTVSDTSNSQYIIQASTNLIDWTSLETNTAPFIFSDPQASLFDKRFYRALLYSPAN